MEYKEECTKFYQNLGIYEVPLHEKCPNAFECWAGGEGRKPSERWANISSPWIGKYYDRNRILCLGKNLNEWGGFDALDNCIKTDLTKINRNKTNLYLWMGMAVLILLSKRSQIPEDKDDYDYHKVSQERLNYAFENLAFTNAIKCSPVGQKSEVVSSAMWPNCSRLILSKELEILNPNVIIFFSAGNLPTIINVALANSKFIDDNGHNVFHLFRNEATEGPKLVIGTYHPSYQKYLNYSAMMLEGLKSLTSDEF